MSLSVLRAQQEELEEQTQGERGSGGAKEKDRIRSLVLGFLEKVSKESGSVNTLADYVWLVDVAQRWEAYVADELGEVVHARIASPRHPLSGGPGNEELRAPAWISDDLFRLFLMTEPSSGKVCTAFSSLLLRELENADQSPQATAERIRRLCALVKTMRRYPSIQIANYVMERLDQPDEAIQFLRTHLAMKATLAEEFQRVFRASMEKLALMPDSRILVYGYSETLLTVLDSIAPDMRPRFRILVGTRPNSPRGVAMTNQIGTLGFENVSKTDFELLDVFANKEADHVLMGCKTFGLLDSTFEVANTAGSGAVAQQAYNHEIPVTVVGGSYKIWDASSYAAERNQIAEQKRVVVEPLATLMAVAGLEDLKPQFTVTMNDLIPAAHITWVLTEDGLFTPEAFVGFYVGES
jgi:translation initiation factor 2B subunit (eIF-2B alpha/beta/delta family)